MEVIESYSQLNRKDLDRIESRLGLELPPDYKDFLLKYNGGKPVPDGVSYEGEYFDFVSFFYAARFNTYYNDIYRNFDEYKGLIPPHYFPFAESPCGNVYCLSLRGEDYSSVYCWDHETANYDGEPWEENMIKLSNSLSEFLSGLGNYG